MYSFTSFSASRRSPRLAKLPRINYYTKEDMSFDISEVLYAICIKKGYIYSDDMVDEYLKWVGNREQICNIGSINHWIKYDSYSFYYQRCEQKIGKIIAKYCIKNNIEYDPKMPKKYITWRADPANLHLTTYKPVDDNDDYFPRESCYTECPVEDGFAIHKTTRCIKNWFSTLKKTVQQ